MGLKMIWTKAGEAHKASVNTAQYQIKKVSEICQKCSGTGRIGELVKVSICCSGYEDKNGHFLSCPNETDEDDCIVYKFQTEDGTTSFEACKDCGPLRAMPARVIMKEKINSTFIGKEVCPDCSKDGDFIEGTGKISTYQLISTTGEILATSKSRHNLQMQIYNLHCCLLST